jgi:hypothetical protein
MISDALSDAYHSIAEYQENPIYDIWYADMRPWIDGVREVMDDMRAYLDSVSWTEEIDRRKAQWRAHAEAGICAYHQAMVEVRREVAALKAGVNTEAKENFSFSNKHGVSGTADPTQAEERRQ